MKKLVFLLAVIVVASAGYLVYRSAYPYAGLVTHMDVENSEEVVLTLTQQRDQALAGIESAYKAGERPDLNLFIIAAMNSYYLGDLVSAREIYEEYFKENAINPGAWSTYGNILSRMQDWEKAEEAYRTAISLGGMEADYMDLVRLLEKDPDRFEEIEGVLLEAVSKLGQTRFLMVALADWYEQAGDCERAIAHLNVAKTLAESSEMITAIESDISSVRNNCVEAQ